jgi:hypothetical protein
MELIAKWAKHQDSSMEEPYSVRWANGTPATVEDFKRHQVDTHCLRFDELGQVEQHFFPEIIAEATFDRDAKDWVVKGQGFATFGLELNDPEAKDEQIVAELYTFPTVYRTNIVRSVPKAGASSRS